jgi:hypothetical protein
VFSRTADHLAGVYDRVVEATRDSAGASTVVVTTGSASTPGTLVDTTA